MSPARAICIFLFTLILFVGLLECRRSHSQYKHSRDAMLKQNRGDRRELARSKGRHSVSSPRFIDFSEKIDREFFKRGAKGPTKGAIRALSPKIFFEK
jgi:hypothetical protein